MSTFNQITHKAPDSCGTYHGGYVRTTKCVACDRIAFYNEAHPSDPCQLCGNKVVEYNAAKWVKPIYEIRFIFFKKMIRRGYWDFSKPEPQCGYIGKI